MSGASSRATASRWTMEARVIAWYMVNPWSAAPWIMASVMALLKAVSSVSTRLVAVASGGSLYSPGNMNPSSEGGRPSLSRSGMPKRALKAGGIVAPGLTAAMKSAALKLSSGLPPTAFWATSSKRQPGSVPKVIEAALASVRA